MALIKCPECGRENVSDSAEACPGCGYGIRKHFERINNQNKQTMIEERDIIKPISNISDKDKETFKKYTKNIYTGDNAISRDRQYTIKRLEKELADEIRTKTIAVIAAIISSVLCVICYVNSSDGSLGVLIAIFFGVTLFCIVGLYMSMGSTEQMRINLRIAKEDYNKYLRDIEEENKREILHMQMKEDNQVKCPYCGSYKTTKISSFAKGVSVAVFGIYAAGKVSKQWHCNKCGSEF